MKILKLAALSLVFCSLSAFAADGKVNILSPKDGAVLDSKMKSELKFDVTPNAGGDHLHFYVDGKRVDIIHEWKGTEEVEALPPGHHKLCLEVNTKAHVSTGLEGCVDVTSK